MSSVRNWSVPYINAPGTPVTDFTRAAASAGFRQIGGAVMHGPMHEFRVLDRGEVRELKRTMDDLGVTMMDAGGIVVDERTDTGTALPFLDVAAELDATCFIVPSYDPEFSRMCDKFGELCELAGQRGLVAALEFGAHMGVRDLAEALQLLATVDAANAGIALDTVLWFRSGATLLDLACFDPALITLVQLCDAPAVAPPAPELRQESLFRRCFPGDGGLALSALMEALPETVHVSIEVPNALGRFGTLEEVSRTAWSSASRVISC